MALMMYIDLIPPVHIILEDTYFIICHAWPSIAFLEL